MNDPFNIISENFDLSPLVSSVIAEAQNKFGEVLNLSVHVEMNDDMVLSVTVMPEDGQSQLLQ